MSISTLTSWKEIAAYLGKGVRTVQRWERQFGLPVRRPSAKSHIIFALPQELDSWVKRHHTTPNHLPAGALETARALETAKKERQKQHELLSRLRSSYSRLEASERVLGRNVNRLIEGMRAHPLNSGRRQLSLTRAEKASNSTRMQSKGAA